MFGSVSCQAQMSKKLTIFSMYKSTHQTQKAREASTGS